MVDYEILLQNTLAWMFVKMSIDSLSEDLKRSIEECEPDKAKEIAKQLVNAKVNPLTIIDEVLNPTMGEIGERFDKMEIFLPELMVSAKAMQEATNILMEGLKGTTPAMKKGKIVIGTVHGDIHEIGKDIVKVMLEVSGFEVIDLGKDITSMQFIEKAEEVNADVIALSSLMTTTMSSQKEVIELLEALGKRDNYIVIIGGAPTTEAWQKEINADGWTATAGGAGKLVSELMEKKSR